MTNIKDGTKILTVLEQRNKVYDSVEMSESQVEFSVFCIEHIASNLGLSGDKGYQLLNGDYNILDEYIIPNYEILHTQSKEYIVNDIIDYMKECGVLK